ncbi:MAG TPA: S49 family peptidase, partial [Planctomycetaceae bacterium]
MYRYLLGCSLSAVLMLGVLPSTGRADDKDKDKDAAAAGTATYAEIEIKGTYPEGAQLPGLFGELTESLDVAIGRLDKAANDEKIAGVILRIHDHTIGWAKMNTFRKAIARIQAKGKKVHAWLPDASNMDYVLASACNEVVMPEPGTLMLVGMRAEVSFYKGLFDLIGVKAEMLRVGEFKSAAEPYTRTTMSPEFRKEMEEILDDRFQMLVDAIAGPRKLAADKVKAAIDEGPLTSRQAKTLGLIDRVAYEDELEASLAKAAEGKVFKVVKKYGKKKTDTDFSGLAGMMKMMEMLMGV